MPSLSSIETFMLFRKDDLMIVCEDTYFGDRCPWLDERVTHTQVISIPHQVRRRQKLGLLFTILGIILWPLAALGAVMMSRADPYEIEIPVKPIPWRDYLMKLYAILIFAWIPLAIILVFFVYQYHDELLAQTLMISCGGFLLLCILSPLFELILGPRQPLRYTVKPDHWCWISGADAKYLNRLPEWPGRERADILRNLYRESQHNEDQSLAYSAYEALNHQCRAFGVPGLDVLMLQDESSTDPSNND